MKKGRDRRSTGLAVVRRNGRIAPPDLQVAGPAHSRNCRDWSKATAIRFRWVSAGPMTFQRLRHSTSTPAPFAQIARSALPGERVLLPPQCTALLRVPALYLPLRSQAYVRSSFARWRSGRALLHVRNPDHPRIRRECLAHGERHLGETTALRTLPPNWSVSRRFPRLATIPCSCVVWHQTFDFHGGYQTMF